MLIIFNIEVVEYNVKYNTITCNVKLNFKDEYKLYQNFLECYIINISLYLSFSLIFYYILFIIKQLIFIMIVMNLMDTCRYLTGSLCDKSCNANILNPFILA